MMTPEAIRNMTDEEAINYAYLSDDVLVKRLLDAIVTLEQELSFMQLHQEELPEPIEYTGEDE
jgi:hypothetical protein